MIGNLHCTCHLVTGFLISVCVCVHVPLLSQSVNTTDSAMPSACRSLSTVLPGKSIYSHHITHLCCCTMGRCVGTDKKGMNGCHFHSLKLQSA